MECDKCGRDNGACYHIGGGVYWCSVCLGVQAPKMGAKHRNDNTMRKPWDVNID